MNDPRFSHSNMLPAGCRESPVESIESSMEHKQRILDRIDDPTVRKILVMRWWEHGEIAPGEAEKMIRDNALEAA